MEDDAVIGHVIATRGWLEPLAVPVLGLGPLGVLPKNQGSGVGSALVHAVLAEAAGERAVALLGAPAHYRRFGFLRSTDPDIVVLPDDTAARSRSPVRRS